MADFAELIRWCGDTGTTHLTITLGGETVVDQSWGMAAETTHDVGSIQKLCTGLALAQMVSSEQVRLDQPVHSILGSGWSDAPSDHEQAITVSHLATMTAGLDDDLRPIHRPGAGWYYCNIGYHLLRGALERVDGRSTADFFRARVLDPCDMARSSFAPRDADDPESLPALRSNGRDIARLGRALRDPDSLGADPAVVAELRRGTAANPSYGHLCWLYGGRRAIVTGHADGAPAAPGRRFGGIALDRPIAAAIPEDGFGGTGLGDQRLTVVPSKDAVIVRLGRPSGQSAGTYDAALWERIPAVLHATRGGP